jgi:hypothetical protein
VKVEAKKEPTVDNVKQRLLDLNLQHSRTQLQLSTTNIMIMLLLLYLIHCNIILIYIIIIIQYYYYYYYYYVVATHQVFLLLLLVFLEPIMHGSLSVILVPYSGKKHEKLTCASGGGSTVCGFVCVYYFEVAC